MSWIPTTSQLETLVSHAQARMPAAVSARVLGVEVEDLRAFAERLAKGRAGMIPETGTPAADGATPRDMRDGRVFR